MFGNKDSFIHSFNWELINYHHELVEWVDTELEKTRVGSERYYTLLEIREKLE